MLLSYRFSLLFIYFSSIQALVSFAVLNQTVQSHQFSDWKVCKPWMFRQSDARMCQSYQPHVSALFASMIKLNAGVEKESCRALKSSEKNVRKGFPLWIQSCCVQSCRIFENSTDHVGYFLSGTRGLDTEWEPTQNWVEDSRCSDCWGIVDVHTENSTSTLGALCKRGETQIAHVPPKKGFFVLAIDQLPLCDSATFFTPEGKAENAPSWILKNGTRPQGWNESPTTSPGLETGNDTDTSASASDGNNNSKNNSDESSDSDKDKTNIWAWLGPVLAALIAGICGIVAMRCGNTVTIKTNGREGSEQIEEVRVQDGSVV